MTGQVPDSCEYQRTSYEILGVTGEKLPTAASFHIIAEDLCTGYHRGYVMHYVIEGDRLLLMRAVVTTRKQPPEINGVAPVPDRDIPNLPMPIQYLYDHLNYPVPFTGTLLIVKDLIREYYMHMGFQPAWTYKTLLKLTLNAGVVTSASDVSTDYAKEREREGPKETARREKLRKAEEERVQKWQVEQTRAKAMQEKRGKKQRSHKA